MYQKFTINVPGNNTERYADTNISCSTGEKKKLLFIGIAPSANEDVWIKVYKRTDCLTGEGIYHAIIDDYTHRIDFDTMFSEGEHISVSAYGSNPRTIYGVYAYEKL